MHPVKCFLVGAGPGDIGLLTLKAFNLLKKANVVVYDNLIPKEALSFCPKNSKKIYVGKTRSKKDPKQKTINNILIKECLLAKNKILLKSKKTFYIIRLKGGDPFIFGRGYEEINALKENKIPFEIIPGISSFYAVSTYAGIPLTLRESSRSFSVMTGHFKKEDNNKDMLISSTDTVIYLMGIKNIKKIIEKNIKANKPLDTPIAIIENGCTLKQKTTVSTLGNIKEQLKNKQLKLGHPGLIIMGDVVKCRNTMNWYEKKPLFGKNIVITRNLEELPALNASLTNFGANVTCLPVISNDSYQKKEKFLIEKLKENHQKMIIFTSSRAVNRFFETLKKNKKDIRILYKSQIISIGKETTKTIKKYHLNIDLKSKNSSQEGIVTLLKKQSNLNKVEIILPRALESRKVLEAFLKEKKIPYSLIPLYKTTANRVDLKQIHHSDAILFASPSAVNSFFSQYKKTKIKQPNPIFVCIGPITRKEVEKWGYPSKSLRDKPSFENLAKLVVNLLSNS